MDKMVIARLLLVNYLRMSAAGIVRFVYTPDQTYILQLVLGSNGSGKSSLMNELWPLPADKEHFGVNGKKELDIDYKGHFYQLSSNFEGKPHHSFICDGVELNDGGKIEMFRALSEEHFGVTTEMRTLALDKELLTNMTPARRRYWMVKLADTDFTYAMSRYNLLREAHRDAQGAIKRLQKRLVDEKLKLVEPTVVEEINVETKGIKTLIDEIYGLRNAGAPKSSDIADKVRFNAELLNRYSNTIDNLNLDMLQTSGFNEIQHAEAKRDELKLEIHSSQAISQHLYTEHTRLQKKYDLLIKAGTESIGELTEKVEKATEEIAYKKTFVVLTNVLIENDPQQMKDVLSSIYNQLFECISALKPNDGLYTRSTVQSAEEIVDTTKGQLKALEARIGRLTNEVEHCRNHFQQNTIACPNCKHSWTTKASEDDIKKAQEALVLMDEEYVRLVTNLNEQEAYLKEYGEYAEKYRHAIFMIRSVPILANHFNEIIQNNRLVKYPNSVLSELPIVMSDLDHLIEIEKLKKIVESSTEQIELKKNLDADTLENIEKELNLIEEASSKQTQKVTKLNNDLRHVDWVIKEEARIRAMHEQMLAATKVQEEHVRGYVYSRYQEMLWTLIMNLQTQLARKEDALAAINSQQQIVIDIESQLEEAIMNEKVAKLAHIALSPSNGAIAEGLHRFINQFVLKMNKVIGSIWTYPLEIQTFKLEEGSADMDYKFPFTRNKGEKPFKDVDEGSESMIDMFNHAFKVCALKQLGLGHLPLFLDEFASSFDDAHREKAIYFIKKMLDESQYGQIFMVSHYESGHGALSNLAQTCVLSKDNLLLPSDIVFNQHVSIN